MTLTEQFVALAEHIDSIIRLPRIKEIYISPTYNDIEKSSKFGVMVLDDTTVGLTYVGLDNALQDLHKHSKWRSLVGGPPVEAARLYASENGWESVLGIAAINAISQHVLQKSAYSGKVMNKTVDMLQLNEDDKVGMVGYFPPLVEQIRALNIQLTVLELDPQWLDKEESFEVTMDPQKLNECTKVICTATTLINHSLDSILDYCQGAEQVNLVGPTAGCLPDPLFSRGVTSVGGSCIADVDRFIHMWSNQEPWRESAQRYTLYQSDYPGVDKLLDLCVE